MVLGGYPDSTDVEWVEFGGQNISASLAKPANLPITDMMGSAANIVEGQLIICGGNIRSECFTYDSTITSGMRVSA